MAISGAIAAVSTVGSMVVGHQQKQKMKGEAGKIQRDAQAAQDAADAKLREQHDANIRAQSQAAGVTRAALESPAARPATLISPNRQAQTTNTAPLPAPIAPVQRKTLLGQ